jgi:hypothetical protein
MKKIKRYIITFDTEGDEVVWFQYADFSVMLSALSPFDIEGSETPATDLRDPDFRS